MKHEHFYDALAVFFYRSIKIPCRIGVRIQHSFCLKFTHASSTDWHEPNSAEWRSELLSFEGSVEWRADVLLQGAGCVFGHKGNLGTLF